MKVVEKLFEHDCDMCYFLGIEDGYDLYVCGGEISPTVIARYGNEGHEYMSGMFAAREGGTPVLLEAKERALKIGLLEV